MGAPGSGKSTVGPLVAERLGLPFADVDAVIEARAGRPITDIFVEDGEPAFRALEEQVTAELLAAPVVLALGGGAVLSARTRAALRRSPGDLAEGRTVGGGPADRPERGPAAVARQRPGPAAQAAERPAAAVREACATESVETDGLTPEAVVDLIMSGARV